MVLDGQQSCVQVTVERRKEEKAGGGGRKRREGLVLDDENRELCSCE